MFLKKTTEQLCFVDFIKESGLKSYQKRTNKT